MYPVFRVRFVGGGSTPLALPMVRDLRGQARAYEIYRWSRNPLGLWERFYRDICREGQSRWNRSHKNIRALTEQYCVNAIWSGHARYTSLTSAIRCRRR